MIATESASLTKPPPLKDEDYCICCDLWKPSCGKAIEEAERHLDRMEEK